MTTPLSMHILSSNIFKPFLLPNSISDKTLHLNCSTLKSIPIFLSWLSTFSSRAFQTCSLILLYLFIILYYARVLLFQLLFTIHIKYIPKAWPSLTSSFSCILNSRPRILHHTHFMIFAFSSLLPNVILSSLVASVSSCDDFEMKNSFTVLKISSASVLYNSFTRIEASSASVFSKSFYRLNAIDESVFSTLFLD